MTLRTLVIWVVIAVVAGVVAVVVQQNPSDGAKRILYSQFVQEAAQHQIARVSIKGDEIIGADKSGDRFTTVSPMLNDGVLVALEREGVNVEAQSPRPPLLNGLIQAVLPILLLAGLWFLIIRQIQVKGATGSGILSSGRGGINPHPILSSRPPNLWLCRSRSTTRPCT